MRRSVEAGPAAPIAQTEQAANHQGVVRQCCRHLEEPIEFLIVLIETAPERRPDEGVLGIVQGPPTALEVQQGALAVGEFGLFCHPHSLPGRPARYKYPGPEPVAIVCGAMTISPALEPMQRPFLIGVAGGACSGKTTISEKLAELAGAEHVSLIKLDSYYVASTHELLEERERSNYDHPDTFDWSLLNDHLAALVAGATVPVPVYDYADYRRSDEVRMVAPARIVVVEGILVLYDVALRERFDLRVFVDTDADIRLIRRLARDVAERGRTPDSIITQYLATVRPSHEQFVEPSKRHADVILPHGGMNEPALDVLLARVRELVRVA